MNEIFRKNAFALSVVCSGSFLDNAASFEGDIFSVETAVVRLNGVAMNEWIFSAALNPRSCYNTDQEWQDYLAVQAERKKNFNEKLAVAVGFDVRKEGISVAQAVSEVFVVTQICKVAGGVSDNG